MHLIICNERLLFRFGVDRVLLLLAQGLKAAGWKITFIAQRVDHQILQHISDHIHTPPPHTGDYLELDRVTADWLRHHRHLVAPSSETTRTVALIGGWPFYSAIPIFRQWSIPTVALDCGGVPYEDIQGPARLVQEHLRTLRREYLPEAQAITPISHFIARTQSRPDAGGEVPITTIHLGADHLATDLWPTSDTADTATPQIHQGSAPLILNLGRWETGNYKNSAALYPIARHIIQHHPQARFGILATASELEIPPDLEQNILALGHPSDATLNQLMAQADLGISVSRWEGFNLPLAEMQQLDKPVLVLNIGAHPEVVAHPDQLCENETQIAEQSIRVLAGQALSGTPWQDAISTFKQNFHWQRTIQAYAGLLTTLPKPNDAPAPQIILDASACLRDPANTGVARVVRSLARKLQDFGQPLFVAWDEQRHAYVLPTEAEYQNLAAYGGPNPTPAHYILPRSHPTRRLLLASHRKQPLGSWLLQGEIVFERQGPERRAAARALGLKVAAIFYDAIPVTHPHWVPDTHIRDNHADYMTGLAACDIVLPISPDAAHNLKAWWDSKNITTQASIRTCWIAGELTAAPRATQPAHLPAAGQPLRLLCVSTLEPRKNHQALLQAMQLLATQHPDLNWQLDLIGNRYAGADTIVEAVRQASQKDPRIVWHGIVDDTQLNHYYAQSHLTIYPSLVEGYGMPIVESLWHARPCLCHNAGVMAQLAEEGGCLTLDMTNPGKIAQAIVRLASEPPGQAEYTLLAEQAISRPILTWRSYARHLLRQLTTHHPALPPQPLPRHWQHLLIAPHLPLLEEAGQLPLATLLTTRPPRSVLLLGHLPEWVIQLIESVTPQIWHLMPAPLPTTITAQGKLSRINAPLEHSLPALLTELARQNNPLDLVILNGSSLSNAPAVHQALTHLSPALLLIIDPEANNAAQTLGLPANPDIELPGMLGYQRQNVQTPLTP